MKASELRIGNLVKTSTDTVVPIQSDGISAIDKGLLIVEPIPLTEEWLLKFGFELDREDFFVKTSKSGDVLLMEFLDDSWCASVPHLEFVSTFGNQEDHTKVAESRLSTTMINNNGGFDYVHQLQNIYFALTNEELTQKTPTN